MSAIARTLAEAMEEEERRKMYPRCIKCGEETPMFQMSKQNKRMCQLCWDVYDMDRLKEIEPEKEREDGGKDDNSVPEARECL